MSLLLSKLLQNSSSLPLNNMLNLADLSSTTGEMFLVAPEKIGSEVYVFDTRGDEEVTLESDITDNYVEDNTSVQDHIGLKPETITLTGYVGELNNKPAEELKDIQDANVRPLIESFNPFAPQITASAQYVLNRAEEAFNIYKKMDRTLPRLEDALNRVPVPPQVTNQQKVFATFEELWRLRRTVTVYTPFMVMQNMAIQSVHAKQGENSAYISDFTVTFKKIRKAESIRVYSDEVKQKSAKAAMSMAKQKDKGVRKSGKTELANIVDTTTNTVKGVFKKPKG